MTTSKSAVRTLLLGLVMMLPVTACDNGPTAGSTPTTVANRQVANKPATAPGQPGPGLARTPATVQIALGYVPDVQFAPFYMALNKGYYKEENLDVTFKHGIVPDLLKQVANGENGLNFAVASGDEVITAHSQGLPLIYVMTVYRRYPVAAISINGQGPTLKSPADLKGRTVGVPGPFGTTYTGLLALLKAGGLTLNSIKLKTIGFTQVESLLNKQVDVAMGYAANEPVQLKSQGKDVSTLLVADHVKLASNGLVTNQATFRDKPSVIARLVRATQKGIEDTIKDPAAAFEQALKQVPQAGEAANREKQMKVLEETVALLKARPDDPAAQSPTGWTDVQVWEETQNFLFDTKLISTKSRVGEIISNRFLGNTGP